MDAKPASSVTGIRILVGLCIAVIVGGVAWPAWDMFGSARRPMLQGWDDSFYYFWLPSVVIDHDIDFTNQLAHSGTIDPSMRDLALTLPRTPTGLLENKYPPGWALSSLPFFLLAHLFAPESSTGFEPVYLVSVWLGQLWYAIVGVWLATKILTRYFSAPTAVVAALTGWLASPMVYYQTARLSMSHSVVFTLAMAVFWIALRIRDGETRPRWWILLGFLSALLVVTRNVAVVYLAMPGWIVIRKLHAAAIPRIAWLLLGAALPLVLQMIAWKLLHGSWIAYSYGGERFDFGNLHLFEILFSPLHGWFYWHPITAIAIAAFVVWAANRAEGRAWSISLVVMVVLSAAWPTWWLGSSFGYRGLEVATLFVMIGIAMLLDVVHRHRALRIIVSGVIGVAIVWNLALLMLFLTQRIPREAPVTHGQAARALLDWLANR